MPHLYIIAGPHGAGKTKAIATVLPNVFKCSECLDVDDMPMGITPFDPMYRLLPGATILTRMARLMMKKADFAIKTTLAKLSYVRLVGYARKNGYGVTLLYYWLPTPEMSKERVKKDIPEKEIVDTYYKSIRNMVHHVLPICDNWMIINSSGFVPVGIAIGKSDQEKTIIHPEYWEKLLEQSR
jgi:predicted ABC-type ATPase